MKRKQVEELHSIALSLSLPILSRVSLGLVIRALALESQTDAFDSRRVTKICTEVN
jgi:hypothetical protein